MKQPQTLALTAILAVAVGMVGLNGVQGDLFASNTDVAGTEGAAMLGHVVVTHMDENGNVLSYSQSDNVITLVGKNCAAVLIFGTGAASCGSPAVFAHIALSPTTLTGGQVDDQTTVLANECDPTTDDCGDGLEARNGAGITVGDSSTGANNADPVVSISATFTKTNTGSNTIGSAGLFDTGTLETGKLFAVQNFGSTVTLEQNESLQVDWLITLGAPFT